MAGPSCESPASTLQRSCVFACGPWGDWRVVVVGSLVWAAAGVWGAAGVWVSVSDLRVGTIPRRVTWSASGGVLALLAAAAALSGRWGRWGWAILGAASILAVFEVVYRRWPGKVGYGDVRLMALNGLLAGWWGLEWSWWAVVAGAVAAWPAAIRSLARDGIRGSVRWAPGLVAGAGAVLGWLLWAVGPLP